MRQVEIIYLVDKHDKIELCTMNAIIKRGILCSYNVTVSDSRSLYKGTAHIEDNNLCLSMNSCDPILKSSTFHRFELSTDEKRNQLFGFWLSFDGDKKSILWWFNSRKR